MKNVLLALILLISGTTVSSASCSDGTCVKTPLKTGGIVALSTTKKIVTFPYRVVKKVQQKRTSR